MEGTRLRIGDLAGRAGMSPSALRYYEAAGLLDAKARTESGYRLYGQRAAQRLDFIRRAKALGLKLSEIRRLIDSPRGAREDERALFDRFLASKLDETRSQIAALRATTRRLRGLAKTLNAQPPAEWCHLGDCACWLPG